MRNYVTGRPGPLSWSRVPTKLLIRTAVTAFHQARRAVWFFTRPHTTGVHAIALTPQDKVVLVRLTYRPGWHLPGGMLDRGESEAEGVLREMREEIGLQGWTSCREVDRFTRRLDWKHDTVVLFRVENVTYAPRRSLEIAEVAEFAPTALPEGLPESFAERVVRAIADASQG